MATTARKKAAPKQLTTAQRLDSIIKSARKIMRKDKGLNGDLDRLPMLTWIMFLKFLDDMERIEEGRAELAGKDYRSIIEAPYRWRDWAADADGITGPDLLSFLVSEMTERPDGTRGPGSATSRTTTSPRTPATSQNGRQEPPGSTYGLTATSGPLPPPSRSGPCRHPRAGWR